MELLHANELHTIIFNFQPSRQWK